MIDFIFCSTCMATHGLVGKSKALPKGWIKRLMDQPEVEVPSTPVFPAGYVEPEPGLAADMAKLGSLIRPKKKVTRYFCPDCTCEVSPVVPIDDQRHSIVVTHADLGMIRKLLADVQNQGGMLSTPDAFCASCATLLEDVIRRWHKTNERELKEPPAEEMELDHLLQRMRALQMKVSITVEVAISLNNLGVDCDPDLFVRMRGVHGS